MNPLVIKSDIEALTLLERIIAGESIAFDDVEFDNWPRLNINIKGERYDSTITPELMKGFLEFQKAINKSYALARYSASSRNLKDSERDDLKILLHVEQGSSEFRAKLNDQIDKIGDAFMQMESKDKLKAFLSIGLFVVGGYAWTSYLDNKLEQRKLDIQAIELEAERNERLDTLSLLGKFSDTESERLKLVLGHVTDRYPEIESMQSYTSEAYDKLLSGASDAEIFTAQGYSIPGPVVAELSTTKRQKSVGDVITGVYRILGVDHSIKEHYKFKLRDVLRDQEFIATLPKDGAMVTDNIVEILSNAEWKNKVVMLRVLTKNNRGNIVSAQIEKVTEITDQEIYEETAWDADNGSIVQTEP